MPELPEVETVKRCLTDAVIGRSIQRLTLQRDGLREKFPPNFKSLLQGATINEVERRGKYLILICSRCYWLVHFGMSGYFTLQNKPPFAPHSHVCAKLDNNQYLVYTDPRRFGRMTVTTSPWQQHLWLAELGVEPLNQQFTAQYLHRHLQNKNTAIKLALMDSRLVVGVGNIYAAESLFMAGILPTTAAHRLTPPQCKALVMAIKKILKKAIAAGGSTIRDFANTDGEAGYFQMQWQVYGRANLPCRRCGKPIYKIAQSGRSTFFCKSCQQ